MRVILVYDSVSAQKLTEKVASIVVETLREAGLEVDSLSVKDADPAKVKEYDGLIVGTPTMAWRPTPPISKFLESLSADLAQGRRAATFDTQIKSGISGNANKKMMKLLRQVGFKIASEPLIAYVEGKTDQMRLKDGEAEKAKAWARDLSRAMSGR